jgi:hypothetical protein
VGNALAVEPFRAAFEESSISDLRERLARRRPPLPHPGLNKTGRYVALAAGPGQRTAGLEVEKNLAAAEPGEQRGVGRGGVGEPLRSPPFSRSGWVALAVRRHAACTSSSVRPGRGSSPSARNGSGARWPVTGGLRAECLIEQ